MPALWMSIFGEMFKRDRKMCSLYRGARFGEVAL